MTLPAVTGSATIEQSSEGFGLLTVQFYNLGAALGAVFVEPMVGVTTDLTEVSVVCERLGNRPAIAYMTVSAITATVVASLTNFIHY